MLDIKQSWGDFRLGDWSDIENFAVNVGDFINLNYQPYLGDEQFLNGPTQKSLALWEEIEKIERSDHERGKYSIAKNIAADVNAFEPGYIGNSKIDNVVVGVQTDQPLKRPIMPRGGWRSVQKALAEKGETPDPKLGEFFTKHIQTHNDVTFSLYTSRVRKCRKSHILSALPDNAARGRLIGDYRRVALYGVDYLIAAKKHDLDLNAHQVDQKATDEVLQLRQELGQQIRALNDLKDMAKSYGFDISNPAGTAQEAVQWLYFGYLAAIKQQDGAAMSIGRIDTFLDIFIDKDLRAGLLSESAAQELIDNLIIKLRIVRFLRLEDFDAMYTGDPIWATVTLGGINDAAQPLVTKTSYRILHTLENLNPSPEPNMTVLWTDQLPESFKLYCTSLSILTSSIQYENDDIIRTKYDDDTAIACCVSPVPKRKGVQSIQLFGARMNGVKALLYGLNGGRDEVSGDQIFDPEVVEPYRGEILDYDQVYQKHFQPALEHLVQIYVEALNCIHFSHDRYFYESLEMALHDTNVKRTMGCGLAGLSHIVDSLSAIKYAKVRPVRDRSGLIVDYEVEGEFPTYGNDDQRADSIAEEVVKFVDQKLKDQYMYRQAEATLSLLTITANVEYGKNTGASPCGRRAGQPLAPGANPSNGSDKHGVIASMVSVGKIDFENCQDGISLTTTMTPQSLGSDHPSRKQNLTNILDKMFSGNSESRLYHSNINVLTSELLKDAYENPDDPRFNNLCIRISGYCVLWSKLTQEQRLDILSRTLHDTL